MNNDKEFFFWMKKYGLGGRVIGITASLCSASLWLTLVWARFDTYREASVDLSGVMVVSAMIILALAGIYASLKLKPLVMCWVFAGSFLPCGLYMLGAENYYRWIDIFNLLYLVSAILIFLEKGRATFDDG